MIYKIVNTEQQALYATFVNDNIRLLNFIYYLSVSVYPDKLKDFVIIETETGKMMRVSDYLERQHERLFEGEYKEA